MVKINKVTRLGRDISGFTIIEIIAALLIVGILSAVAVSRIGSTQSYSLAAEADILKTHLRYVHLRSLADVRTSPTDVRTWGMSFAGNTYTMMLHGNSASYNLPNEDSPTHTLPSGITIESPVIVTFDEWGTPVDASGNPVASNITINISAGGETIPITVTQSTGFVP